MKYTDNEMCVILLCSYIGVDSSFDVKPLSQGEWNKFLAALLAAKKEPKIIYDMTDQEAKSLGYDPAFAERVRRLADRGAAVGFELQEYERKGIQVITEINEHYPILLRRRLGKKKPPVLFYAGDIGLAGKIGIGVVGSRNVSEAGMKFATELVLKATSENMIIYSGGARGVDSVSENTALDAGGGVVSYIADSLASRIRKSAVADSIMKGRMLLVSDQKPDAGFSAGRAMNRNKYIYASGYGTFVVESDYNKGGTWTGATETMKNNWGKVFVWEHDLEGNKKLIEAGGIPFTFQDGQKLFDVVNQDITNQTNAGYTQMDLTSYIKG